MGLRYFGYYSGVMDYWTHAATASAGDPEDPEAGRLPSKSNRTKSGGPVVNGGLDLHVGGADFGTAGQLDIPVWNASGEYSSDMFARKAGEWIAEHGRDRGTIPMFLCTYTCTYFCVNWQSSDPTRCGTDATANCCCAVWPCRPGFPRCPLWRQQFRAGTWRHYGTAPLPFHFSKCDVWLLAAPRKRLV